jgi:hypothetical protein
MNMREILFRGKTNNGEWEYGVPVFSGLNNELAFIKQMHSYNHQVIPETVGQYTGLNDKNGTKIFEGDIVAFGEYQYTVEWKEDRLGYGYAETADRMLECDGRHCEVIGNIHDNPELLKGE